jgi:hypothetical protein
MVRSVKEFNDPMVFGMFACPNWGVEKILAEAFVLSHSECRATRRGEKSSRPDQKKGG